MTTLNERQIALLTEKKNALLSEKSSAQSMIDIAQKDIIGYNERITMIDFTVEQIDLDIAELNNEQ
jgi:hypothetical protein